tara:strand:- start:3110 stop:3262 length:153 start_codon:yes stop_codon:yes gene_type:complete
MSDKIAIMVRVDPDLKAYVAAIAKKEERSLDATVRLIIRQHKDAKLGTKK